MTTPQLLIHEVARRSTDDLSGQLAAKTVSMDAAELRGYVGAHARGTIRAHAARVLKSKDVDSAQIDEMVDAALARTVHLVASAFQSQPVIAIAPPHVVAAAELVSLPLRMVGATPQSRRAAA